MKRPVIAIILLGVSATLLNACTTDETSATEISSSLTVSTSPAIELETCTPVEKVAFLSAKDILIDQEPYTLLGIAPITEELLESQKEAFATYASRAACMKNDPLLEDDRYIYLFSDSQDLISSDIIADGHALAEDSLGYLYLDYFRRLEQDAKSNGRGLWEGEVRPSRYTPPFPVIAEERTSDFKDQFVTLRMTIRSVGYSEEYIYWNSKEDYREEGNIAIIIDRNMEDDNLALIKKVFLDYEGREVDMSGKLHMDGDNARMYLSNRNQLFVH